MALTGPIDANALPPVSPKALDLAGEMARIALTKFRFRMGCFFVIIGTAVFFIGHLTAMTQYFAPSFTDRSWTLTKWLLILGAAFSGKEVVDSLLASIKSGPK